MEALELLEGLLQIGYEVVGIFNTNTQTNEVDGDASGFCGTWLML